MPQPRGAMASQQWLPTSPATEYLGHGQLYREVQSQNYNGGDEGGRGDGLSAISWELRQARNAPHEPTNISSPEASPRALEVVTEQLEVLPMQGELSASQEIVQAIPLSNNYCKFPHRPRSGSIGTRCLLKANHFLVELPDKDLHQYDVR